MDRSEQFSEYTVNVRARTGTLFSYRSRAWFLCLFCLLSVFLRADPASGNGKGKDYLLVVNSVNFSENWTNRLYQCVDSAFRDKIRVEAEELYVPIIVTMQQADSIRADFQKKYPYRPKAVLIIGDPGWLLCQPIFDGPWKGVPVVLCYSADQIPASFEEMLKGRKREPFKTIFSDRLSEKYNLTVFHHPFYVEQAVRLIQQLLPGLRKVAFISDDRYISRIAREEVARVMRDKFPDLGLDQLSYPSLNTEMLLDSLNHYDNRVGIIYYSWFVDVSGQQAGNTSYLDDKLQRVLYGFSDQPVFTISDINTQSGSFAGGYFVSASDFGKAVIKALEDILSGIPASEIAPRIGGVAGPHLNYRHLLAHGIDANALPSDAVYYQKPPSFFQQNKPLLFALVGAVVLLLLLVAVVMYYYWQRQLQRKRQISLLSGYKRLLSNMPIAYVQGKLSRRKDGHPYDYRILDINPACEKVFGFKRTGVIGKYFSEVFADHPTFGDLKENIGKNTSLSFVGSDGEWHYFDKLVADSSKEDVFDVFYIDRTEAQVAYKHTEELKERYELVLRAARMTIWSWDLVQKKVDCNVEYSIKTAGSSIGRMVFSEDEYYAKIHPQDVDRVREAIRRLADNEVAAINEMFRITYSTDQNRYHHLESYASVAQRDENGRPLMIVGASIDISQRKELEKELVEAKIKAEESNRLKSAFLANMSHEIRTPLNAIVGFSSILASSDDQEEKQEYAHIIENNNHLLLQLINDILDLSKIEAGTLEFTQSKVEIRELLSEVVQMSRLRIAADSSVGILLEGAEEPLLLETDRHRVMQVVANFVNNAIKFTQQGSIRLGYRLRSDSMVYIYVADTGTGIPEDRLEDVFNRFVKLDTFKQGTGLGLSICQSIVERLGGKIGVESEEGKGSTFWFTVPYKPVPEQKVEKEEKEEEIPLEPVEREKLTLLIAEDNASNYKLFESILKKEYNLLHAWDGRQAVEMFKQHAPHLILMDIKMPQMDGYEATAEIRKLSRKVPIIAVTAYAFEQDETNILNSGFDEYASKPIQAQTLKEKIAMLLKKRLIFI